MSPLSSITFCSFSKKGSTVSSAAESFPPWMLRFLIPCWFLNLSNQPIEALKLSWLGDLPFTCSCKEKCFAFSWRSGPEIGVSLDLCWINQVYKAWSNRLSFATFSDFRFNPSLVSMLSANFRILSLLLRISEICCWCQIQMLNLSLFLLYLNVK